MSYLLDRFETKAPKRILSLDGGGIRGAISIGILEKVEKILAEQTGRDEQFRMSDYFDLIIGTSTGAIIAGSLAKGMSVSEVKSYYLKLGGKVFKKRGIFDFKRLKSGFEKEELNKQLKLVFGDMTFESDELKTGLCVVTKRADTGSTWPIINHPKAKYFDQNKDMPVWQVIRASTAAPTYFEPEVIENVDNGRPAAFIDGGISMANNPSLQAFLLATLKGFPFKWNVGEDQLFLLSVGTGCWQDKLTPDQVTDNRLWNWAGEVPTMLMNDANWQNQLLLQAISKCMNPVLIDSDVGNAAGDLVGGNPLMSYVRYEAELQVDALKKLGIDVSSDLLNELRDMSNPEHREQLFKIGQAVARDSVETEHFPEVFARHSSE